MAIVDGLEPVQVHVEHGHLPGVAAQLGQRLVQAVRSAAAIGQPRERVMRGLGLGEVQKTGRPPRVTEDERGEQAEQPDGPDQRWRGLDEHGAAGQLDLPGQGA